jgi:hypothetical protein
MRGVIKWARHDLTFGEVGVLDAITIRARYGFCIEIMFFDREVAVSTNFPVNYSKAANLRVVMTITQKLLLLP